LVTRSFAALLKGFLNRMGDISGVPVMRVATEDDILSRIILTVESITEKFEGIKGELGDTSKKYDSVLEELQALRYELDIMKGHQNCDLCVKVIELLRRMDEMEYSVGEIKGSFKENTANTNDTNDINNTNRIKKKYWLCNIQ
jgi:hypothetical protein